MEDPAEDTFAEAMRLSVTLASRVGEQVARRLERQARAAEAASEQENREYQGRLRAEQAAMRAQLARVEDPRWWDTARPEDVGQMYQTALVWRERDDLAARVAHDIEDKTGWTPAGTTREVVDGLHAAEAATAEQPAPLSEATRADVTAALSEDRDAARRALAQIEQPQWWQQASYADIGQLWTAGQAWRGHDDEIRDRWDQLRSEIAARFGDDLDLPDDSTSDEVAAALEARAHVAAANLDEAIAADVGDHADAETQRLDHHIREGRLRANDAHGVTVAANGNGKPVSEAADEKRATRAWSRRGRRAGRSRSGAERGRDG